MKLRTNNRIYKIDKNGKKRRVFWIRGLNIIWQGSNSTVILHEPCVKFRNSMLVMGENATATFKRSRTKLKKMELHVWSEGGSLEIGENLLPNFNCRINVYREPNLHVKIGDNCMMGPNVEISASDAHCIYQTDDGKVLNKGKNITIGNHCWFTSNVSVFKGVTIADNCIFGAGANITKDCLTPNGLYVGTPAKLIKENVNWDYDFPEGEYHV